MPDSAHAIHGALPFSCRHLLRIRRHLKSSPCQNVTSGPLCSGVRRRRRRGTGSDCQSVCHPAIRRVNAPPAGDWRSPLDSGGLAVLLRLLLMLQHTAVGRRRRQRVHFHVHLASATHTLSHPVSPTVCRCAANQAGRRRDQLNAKRRAVMAAFLPQRLHRRVGLGFVAGRAK